MTRALLTCCILASALLSPTVSAQVRIEPSQPRAGDTIRVVVPQVATPSEVTQLFYAVRLDHDQTTVTMAGNRIAVTAFIVFSGVAGPLQGFDLPIGKLPAGSYEVVVNRRAPNGSSMGDLPAANFAVSPRQAGEPLWNHTDMWWDPAESGWGLSVVHHAPGQLFATWFVYGDDGNPTWYVMPGGQWVDSNQIQGPVYRTSGPDHAACTLQSCPVPFNPALVMATSPGYLRLNFSHQTPGLAQAIFFMDGRFIVKNLRRQPF